MSNDVQILLKATDKASKDISTVNSKLKDLEGGGKEASKGLSSLQGTLMKLGVAVGIAAGAAATFKKAWDISKQGAAAIQTTESFGLLLKKVGAAPNLLDKLKEASRGTISELDLMSSTSTLLAGAQGELATALAGSTPNLMEIAKAANKLNPALGDTNFMYQSLALGIKRASPMILDNLGLTIKVGEANETYAKSIGKTVDQLTAEELKIALLNEVLRSGGTLIDQVGGNTDSATDSFAQAEVAVEELATALKMKLAPAMSTVATNLTSALTIEDRFNDALKDTSGTYDEYIDRLRKFTPAQSGAAKAAFETQLKQEALTEAVFDSINPTDTLTYSLGKSSGQMIEASIQAAYLATKNKELKAAEDEAKDAADRLKESLALVQIAIDGPVGKAYEKLRDGTIDLKDEHANLMGQMQELVADGILPTADEFITLEEKLRENEQAQIDVEAATQKSIEAFIFQQASAGLSAEALLALSYQMGMLDQASYNAALQIAEWKKQLDTRKITISEYTRLVADLNAEMGQVKDRSATVEVHFKTYREEIISTTYDGKRAIGGRVAVGGRAASGAYLVGENGPEIFVPDQHGSILPNNYVTNNTTNFNLTGNYAHQSESTILQEAKLLEMMYG